jgi:hypothetical protein
MPTIIRPEDPLFQLAPNFGICEAIQLLTQVEVTVQVTTMAYCSTPIVAGSLQSKS